MTVIPLECRVEELAIKSIVSIRHSWFAALGVLGDVFCDLAKHLESFTGCGLAGRFVLKDDIG